MPLTLISRWTSHKNPHSPSVEWRKSIHRLYAYLLTCCLTCPSFSHWGGPINKLDFLVKTSWTNHALAECQHFGRRLICDATLAKTETTCSFFCVETSVKNYFSCPVHWVLSPWTPPAAHLAVLQIILPSDHPTLTSYLSHLAEWWKPDPSSSQSAPGKAPGACPSSQIWRTAPPAGPLTPVGSGSSHTGPTQRERKHSEAGHVL